MGVSLTKGGRVSLTKDNPDLKEVVVGLGWDVNAFDGDDYDLDTSAFLLGADKKCTRDKDFIYYKNLSHPSGAVKHMGDNRTGAGEGDDEQIVIDLSKVPDLIQTIAFTVTIFEGEEKRQNFGQVDNAFIHITDSVSGKELVRYDLAEEFSLETAIVAAELYRINDGWSFRAVGNGFNGGLAALCNHFGIEVE